MIAHRLTATRFSAIVLALGISATVGHAQSFTFQIDQASSNYTWSGTTSLGTLQGNPSQSFQLTGTLEQDLSSGGSPVGGGQWLSANALVVPDLSGVIPNPVIFLPPLAQVDITGLSFTMVSDPFACDANGDFATTTTLTILTGTLTVTPLAGSVTVTDLTGTVGPPSATTGNISEAGGMLTLTSPMSTNFQFTDQGSGITADLGLSGTLVANYTCPSPTNYCTTSPNSAGPGVVLTSTGSTSIAANDLVLVGNGGPNGQPGIYYYGPNQISNPFGNGVRCVGAGGIGIFRLPVINSGATGTYTHALDHNSIPGPIAAGETWNFQCWYRDPQGGGANFNLSDGLSVIFCP